MNQKPKKFTKKSLCTICTICTLRVESAESAESAIVSASMIWSASLTNIHELPCAERHGSTRTDVFFFMELYHRWRAQLSDPKPHKQFLPFVRAVMMQEQ